MRDDLREDAFERARQPRAEERIHDHVVAVRAPAIASQAAIVPALDEGERRRPVAGARLEAREPPDDLEVGARVALRVLRAAEEDDIHARAHRPEHARERRAVAAVVAAPAEDLEGLAARSCENCAAISRAEALAAASMSRSEGSRTAPSSDGRSRASRPRSKSFSRGGMIARTLWVGEKARGERDGVLGRCVENGPNKKRALPAPPRRLPSCRYANRHAELPVRCIPHKCSMELFLQKNLNSRKNFLGGGRSFMEGKAGSSVCSTRLFRETLFHGGEESFYFACRLRRRRTPAAMPEMPVPSRSIVAGSGTVVCCAPVIEPVSEAVWPGSIGKSMTLKKNEPVPQVVCCPGTVVAPQVVSLKVNSCGVLLKSIKMPPSSAALTVPVTVAVKVAVLEPLMPCGAVNVTCSVNVVLKLLGAVLSENEPRLLTLAPGLALPPSPRKPPAVVPLKVALL